MVDTKEGKYLTKKGVAQLKQELEELTGVKRKETSQKLQHAIGQGDLSENAEYAEAKEEQAFLEGRIHEIEETLANAKIIGSVKEHGSGVRIGSTVDLENIGAKRKTTFTIVGTEETNPQEGRISHHSPLGQALLGHKTGEVVEVSTPSGIAKWKIKKVK